MVRCGGMLRVDGATIGDVAEIGLHSTSLENELVHDIVGNQFEDLLRRQALDIRELGFLRSHDRDC